MSGAFNHHLHVTLPSSLCKLTETDKLLYLTHVTSVRKTTGTASVTERNRYVVLTADVKDLVVILVEGVFLTCHAHPSKHKRASARDDVHLPLVLSDLLNGLTGNSAMKSYKVNAVLCVKSYYIDKVLCSEGCEVALIVDNAIVYGNRTDHSGTLTCELSAEGLRVSVRREIHNGFCAHIYSCHNLFHFNIVVLTIAGDSEVDVETAKNAGIDGVFVTWGFRDEEELREAGAKVLKRDAKELLEVLI
jgi:hypothetical protein